MNIRFEVINKKIHIEWPTTIQRKSLDYSKTGFILGIAHGNQHLEYANSVTKDQQFRM